jgi:hypothetical protein
MGAHSPTKKQDRQMTRHPFIHGIVTTQPPPGQAPAHFTRRSFFGWATAGIGGIAALLLSRRSSAQTFGPGGGTVTTQALGEEGSGGAVTTYALGEEGSGGTVTTYALGEEGSGGTVTTYALGEEGAYYRPPYRRYYPRPRYYYPPRYNGRNQ